jgi:uncharacterized protein (DUF1778 family)
MTMTSDGHARRSRQGSENRRRQGRVSARVDPDERRRVEEAADRAGMAVAEFIRHVVLAAAAGS